MYKCTIFTAALLMSLISIAYSFSFGTERLPRHIAPSFASTRTIHNLKKPTHTIFVGTFTSSLKSNTIPCRPGKNIKPPLFSSLAGEMEYTLIKDLQSENLFDMFSYSYIGGNLDKFYFNAGDFNDGYWVIQMTFFGKTKSGKMIPPFTIKTKEYYNMSTTEHHYCHRVAEDVGGAVRAFLTNLYSSPQFKKLITS